MIGTSDLNEMAGEMKVFCNGLYLGPGEECNQPLETGSTLCAECGEKEDWVIFSDLWKDDYGFRPRGNYGPQTIEEVREWMQTRREEDERAAKIREEKRQEILAGALELIKEIQND